LPIFLATVLVTIDTRKIYREKVSRDGWYHCPLDVELTADVSLNNHLCLSVLSWWSITTKVQRWWRRWWRRHEVGTRQAQRQPTNDHPSPLGQYFCHHIYLLFILSKNQASLKLLIECH